MSYKTSPIALIRFKCLTKLPSENVIRMPSQNYQKRWSSPRNCPKRWSSPISGHFVSTHGWCLSEPWWVLSKVCTYKILYHLSVLTKYTLLPFCSRKIKLLKCSITSLSPYRFGTVDHLVKNNMPGKLFFVFAKIRVPLVCTYVYCTKWSCNISLIHVKVC